MDEIERKAVASLMAAGFSSEDATTTFNKLVDGYRKRIKLPDEVKAKVKPLLDGTWLTY